MTESPESEQWFANSKQVEISHGGLRLGVCLADTLLREVAKNVIPPENNPIIQELFHDFETEPFFSSDVPSEEHERECLEYIKTNLRWEDLEWHFQADIAVRRLCRLVAALRAASVSGNRRYTAFAKAIHFRR